MKSKNILHFIDGKCYAGAEKHILLLCQNINRQLFNPLLACYAEHDLLMRKFKESNVETQVIKMHGKLDFRIIAKLANFIKDNDISLIHTHTVRTNLIGRFSAKLSGVPIVTTVHSSIVKDTNTDLKQRKTASYLERYTAGLTNRFICTSQATKDELASYGVDSSKISVIYNCVDTKEFMIKKDISQLRMEFGLDSNGPLAGMIASLRPRKGTEYFIQSASIVLKKIPQAKFIIVGSAEMVRTEDYLQKLKDMAIELGISERVIFTDFRDDVPEIMSMLDVLVLPSLFGETSSLVVLEAMSMSKPVIATAIDGLSEIVKNGITGLLVPPKDSVSLADAIISVLQDKERAREMGQQGFLEVRNKYTADINASKVEEVYNNLLEKSVSNGKQGLQ